MLRVYQEHDTQIVIDHVRRRCSSWTSQMLVSRAAINICGGGQGIQEQRSQLP